MLYIRPVIFILGFNFVISQAAADVSFAPPTIIETPGAGADIILLDIDADGDLDIASLEVEYNFGVGQAVGLVNIVFNDGKGHFSDLTTFELGIFPPLEFALLRLEGADLDGDGDPDLAAIGTTAPLVLLFNDGAGGFGAAVDTGIAVSPGPLTAMLDGGDLNGDGSVDFAIALPGQVAINDGTGSFSANQFTNDTNPQNLEIVDLDGDGDLDIAAGFRVHLNDGDANFTQLAGTTYPGSFARECVFEDFDGDSDPDVVCAANFSDELRFAFNNGDATFGPTESIETITAPIDLHAAHFNDDGHLDLFLTHSFGNDSFAIYLGHGDGTFDDAIIWPFPTASSWGVSGDLNGDGLDDIVITTGFVFSSSDEPIAVLLNTSISACIGDTNGDGDVGVKDLLFLLGTWGPCPPKGDCPADFDGSGDVGVKDLLFLLGAWGECP